MTVTIRLPRFASSDYTVEDRKSLVRYLQPTLERTIAGVRVEQRTDRGIVITAGFDGGPEAGAIAAAAAILGLVDQALSRDVQARGARRQLGLIVYAQTRRATITVEVD